MKRLVVTWLVVMAVAISGLPATAQEETEAPEGSRLTTAVSDEQAVTEISIADHAAFDLDGGAAAFEPGTTRAEFFTYDSVDPESGDLVDIRRGDDELFAHPAESFVWAIPGSTSVHTIPADLHGDTARIAVANVEDFKTGGGDAILEPGTPSQERFSYATVDPDTNELVGISRSNPTYHPTQTIVQAKEWSDYPPTTTDEHETSPSPSPSPNSSGTLDAAIADGDPSTSPLPEPVSSALSDEQGPSDDLTAVTDGFVGAVPTETIPPHEVGLDGFVGASSLPTCKDIFGGSCPIDTTNPCDDGAGRTCAQWLQDILSTLGDPDGWCYTAADRRCAQLAQYIIGVIGNPDSWCYTATDRPCAQSLQYVLDLIGDPDSWCYRVTDRQCAELAQYLIGLIDNVCNDNNTSTTGVNECVPMAIELVETVADIACNDNYTGTQGSTECINMVVNAIRDAQVLVCGSSDMSACQQNLINQINAAIEALCNDQSTATTGVNECVPMAIELVETVADIACNDNYTGTQGSTECINMVVNAINGVMLIACGSSAQGTCINNLINAVNTTLATACGTVPVAPGGSTPGDVPPGIAQCAVKLLGTVNLIMTTACQSTDGGTCATNLITKIDQTGGSLCGTVPVTDSGTTTGVPPGVGTCVVKLLRTVDLILTTACQSNDGETCATNLLNFIDTLVATTCGALPTPDGDASAGTLSDGVNACVFRVLGVINQTLTTACGSTDLVSCAENLTSGVDQLVSDLCGTLEPTSSPADFAVDSCMKVFSEDIAAQIDLVYDTVCGDNPTTTECQRQHEQEISTIVQNALLTVCANGVIGCSNPIIELISTTVAETLQNNCQGSSASDCEAEIRTIVDAAVANLCPYAQGDCVVTATEVAQGLLDEAIGLCETTPSTCYTAVRAVLASSSDLASQSCETQVQVVGTCNRYDAAVEHPEGQAIADFVLATGGCSDKREIVALFIPAGVTRKAVETEDLGDETCSTRVGPFVSEGSPDDPEPHENAESNEAESSSRAVTAQGDSKCYSAKANWIHSSITIQGVGGDDLGWLRTTMRRLWGCNSTWWSEAPDGAFPSKVFGYQGTTDDFYWWDPAQYPVFENSEWFCHPPGECGTAMQRVRAAWKVEAFSPCGRSDQKIYLWATVFSKRGGGKDVIWDKRGHCEGLRYPRDSTINTRRDRTSDQRTPGWYGGQANDVYCFAIPDQYRSCHENQTP